MNLASLLRRFLSGLPLSNVPMLNSGVSRRTRLLVKRLTRRSAYCRSTPSGVSILARVGIGRSGPFIQLGKRFLFDPLAQRGGGFPTSQLNFNTTNRVF